MSNTYSKVSALLPKAAPRRAVEVGASLAEPDSDLELPEKQPEVDLSPANFEKLAKQLGLSPEQIAELGLGN